MFRGADGEGLERVVMGLGVRADAGHSSWLSDLMNG